MGQSHGGDGPGANVVEFGADFIPRSINTLASRVLKGELPKVAFVPAVRAVQHAEDGNEDFGGRGLIRRLSEVWRVSPGYRDRELRKQFDSINEFVRQVTESASAEIVIQ